MLYAKNIGALSENGGKKIYFNRKKIWCYAIINKYLIGSYIF